MKAPITIRTNILTNFIVMVTLITTLLLGLQYYSSHQLALEAVNKNFQQTVTNITQSISQSRNSAHKILNVLSMNSDLLKDVDDNKVHPILDDFINVMKLVPTAKSIYVGHENGELYELINLKNAQEILKKYNQADNSRWGIYTIINKDGKIKNKIKFLDKDLNIIDVKDTIIKESIQTNRWYKQAILSNKSITSKVYKFNSLDKNGITFAKKIANTKSVVCMDATVDNLDNYLQKQNFDSQSYITLYQNSGQKVALSKKDEPYNWKELFNFIKNNQEYNPSLQYSENGIDYFVGNFSMINSQMSIVVVIPETVLMNPYINEIKNSIYAAILFIILVIPLILYSTSLIVSPINALMVENKKIMNREFNEVTRIKTNIRELYKLSSSFVNMAKSIEEYQLAQEKLLESIIKLIAEAIDAKSTYTGGHCERVPELAEMLTKAAHDSTDGIFKEFHLKTKDEWRELEIGSWLHDCGKVTTPEYVVDKATKLETINNRIHEIRTRFEVLFRDAQITYLESQLKGEDKATSLEKLKLTQTQLLDDYHFIATSNIGGEFMDKDKQDRIKKIANQEWLRNFNDRLGLSDDELIRYEKQKQVKLPVKEKLLSDKQEHIVKRNNFDYEMYKKDGFKSEVPEHLYNYGEIYNLCIDKGTLTAEERFKINEHVIMSIKMLEQLPFPDHLSKIPEYAGTHHETLIGTGYPRQLTKDELSVPARIMAIADIFEALTASDRPYKKAKTLSQSIKIMSFMVKDEHIDADIFKLFLSSNVYMVYAKRYLKPEQIDEVDISLYI